MEVRFSAPVQTGPGAHPGSCTMGTGSFPGIKSGRRVALTPHRFKCCGQERVELYLYSPYGPYDLYRASVPYKGALYLFYFLPKAMTLTLKRSRIKQNVDTRFKPCSQIFDFCLTTISVYVKPTAISSAWTVTLGKYPIRHSHMS